MKKLLPMCLLISFNSYADMTECLKMTDKSDKNYCLAIAAGSSTFCEKVEGYERRMDCIRKVVAKQRRER